MLFLVACSRPPALSERYQALVKAGQPQQILSEYSRPDLVRQAPVLFPYHVDLGKLHLYSDEPFAPERGAAILAEVKRRLLADSAFYKASRQRLREAFATAQPAPEHDRVELSPCSRFGLQLLLEVDPVQS